MKEFLKTHFDLSRDENIVCLSAVCVFLPYYISAVLLTVIVGYVLIKKNIKEEIFCHSGSLLIPIFCSITFVVATCYKNYFGMMVSVIVLLIFVLGFYIRTVMTGELFEKALSTLCNASVVASAVIIIEKIIHIIVFKNPTHRCFGDLFKNKFLSFYFNPNYLASMMAAIVIICAYKVITKNGNKAYYYLAAALAMITIYFGGSMFTWAEVFFALAVYLFVGNHRKPLGVLFAVCAAAGLAISLIPSLMPRLAAADIAWNSRLMIWNLSLDSIPDSFIFGRGFYSYRLISYAPEYFGVAGYYPAFHSHNLFVEFLLSFGIIGTLIFFAFMFVFFQKVFISRQLLKKSQISILIIAVMAGVLMHSILDMTMLWIQPMMLYCTIFGGIGADEKVISGIFGNKKKI